MRKMRRFIVKEEFKDGTPTEAMFEIKEETLPALGKEQFLVQAEYISVDPYMRSFAQNQTVPYQQFGFQVGKVIESKNKDYPIDSIVVSHSGWCDFAILDENPDEMFGMKPYAPDVGRLPRSLAVGALGMPGIAAYLGLLEVCKPNKGDIVCVTSACGAVGSLVGQIARIKECTVIGFAGSDKKVKILKEELGFHHAFNYRTVKDREEEVLKRLAPGGINCYFDNVGGTLSQEIMRCMAPSSRVAICGAISTCEGPAAPRSRRSSKIASMHVEAFSFTQWDWDTQRAALTQLREWIEKRNIIVKETTTNGFDKLPAAFIGMLKGENIGKAVVKV